MNALIELVLLGNPRGKGRGRTFMRGGRPVTTTPPLTRAYEDNLYGGASRHMLAKGLLPLEGPLFLEIDAWMPIQKSWSKKKKAAALACEFLPITRPDWDNIGKMTDALTGVIWHNDSQIVRGGPVTKRYSLRPRLVVRIGPVERLEPDSPYGG